MMNNKQFVFHTISHFWEMEEIKVSHANCCSVVCLVALVIGQSNPILHGVRVAGAASHRGNVTSDWCLMIWWAAITITLVTQIITSHEWQPAQWLEFMNLFQWCWNRLRTNQQMINSATMITSYQQENFENGEEESKHIYPWSVLESLKILNSEFWPLWRMRDGMSVTEAVSSSSHVSCHVSCH